MTQKTTVFDRIDRWFAISQRGSTLSRELRGGVVTFVTISYILVLNPLILGGGPDVAGGSLEAVQIATSTALAAGALTVLFGFVANLPFALAAGLGINSFVAVSMVQQVTWAEAMGLVLLNGIVIVILGATGARTAIFRAVPAALKSAITVGIGLFIAFIGLVDSGFVTRTDAGPPVQLGYGGSIATVPTLVFVVTLLAIAVLVARKVPGAILIGIAGGTVVAIAVEALLQLGPLAENLGGWNLTVPALPSAIVAPPDFGLVATADPFGSFARVGPVAALMLLLTLVFMNFFDAMGAMTGLARNAGLAYDDGTFPRMRGAFVVEGLGAVVGGGTSSSSSTVYVDSAAGIGEGARTGLASVVTGMLFLLAMFFTPLALIVPQEVGAAALVVVGAMMMAQVVNVEWGDFAVALPAFLTIVTMPLTYSIANGIGIGFISWVIVAAFTGGIRRVHWLLWVVAAGFVLFFARGPLEALTG
ncbi:xanthine/uracil permease [Pseudoclavibacter endophyticus]|uniref:NCS2 family permease n=1 Tax=Pseudoclavibacter endophyticus TaxID=1778590 RepID=A0A6H9WLJ7_9MICO|nr:NCS2 family permease [Pseudoclavibacter endophyticus]KAB1646782.1 NCS2 family permease [Pseudoclavibacter endophyticus]GGA75590.1 xanthine/uracil permease [Pseudoclavibacter endophyticus]